MVKHVVMWTIRGDTPVERESNARVVKASLESLRDRVPGLTRLEVGVDSSHADHACDVVLVSEFESPAALEAYAQHPEHLRVKREMSDLRVARYQVDYVC